MNVPLETPEEDNSFVIRTADREFLFRVGSNAEKSSWILGLSHLPFTNMWKINTLKEKPKLPAFLIRILQRRTKHSLGQFNS